MDSITHIVFGAAVGEIFAGRQLGKRAMLLGALMQSVPDIDFVASFWLDPVSDLVAHRGITHSLVFVAIVSPLLAFLAELIHRKNNISFIKWNVFFLTEMLIHLFLDAFNAYGTGWFEPFSPDRISFNAIFVADPLFSIIPGVAFVALLILRRDHPARKRWANLSLAAVCVYLSVSIINKFIVYHDVKQIAEKSDIKYNRYFTTPTPLNTLLWFVALETDSGYHVGHRSVFDTNEKMHFEYFARGEDLLTSIEDHKPVEQLKRFSQGFYVVQKWSDTLVFSDLRFGQMIGWKDPKARFAFYYYLTHPEDNLLVIQRGRFANWDKNAAKRLIRRMGGEKE